MHRAFVLAVLATSMPPLSLVTPFLSGVSYSSKLRSDVSCSECWFCLPFEAEFVSLSAVLPQCLVLHQSVLPVFNMLLLHCTPALQGHGFFFLLASVPGTVLGTE